MGTEIILFAFSCGIVSLICNIIGCYTGGVKGCVDGSCSHPRAVTWVECGKCYVWYHCICVNVSTMKAKTKDFEFICC